MKKILMGLLISNFILFGCNSMQTNLEQLKGSLSELKGKLGTLQDKLGELQEKLEGEGYKTLLLDNLDLRIVKGQPVIKGSLQEKNLSACIDDVRSPDPVIGWSDFDCMHLKNFTFDSIVAYRFQGITTMKKCVIEGASNLRGINFVNNENLEEIVIDAAGDVFGVSKYTGGNTVLAGLRFKECPKLKTITIKNCPGIKDYILTFQSPSTAITTININDCQNFNHLKIQCLDQISKINLKGCVLLGQLTIWAIKNPVEITVDKALQGSVSLDTQNSPNVTIKYE